MTARREAVARITTAANDNTDSLSACRGLLWATVISAPLWGVLMWVVL